MLFFIIEKHKKLKHLEALEEAANQAQQVPVNNRLRDPERRAWIVQSTPNISLHVEEFSRIFLRFFIQIKIELII